MAAVLVPKKFSPPLTVLLMIVALPAVLASWKLVLPRLVMVEVPAVLVAWDQTDDLTAERGAAIAAPAHVKPCTLDRCFAE